jgi:hypothetical protein
MPARLDRRANLLFNERIMGPHLPSRTHAERFPLAFAMTLVVVMVGFVVLAGAGCGKDDEKEPAGCPVGQRVDFRTGTCTSVQSDDDRAAFSIYDKLQGLVASGDAPIDAEVTMSRPLSASEIRTVLKAIQPERVMRLSLSLSTSLGSLRLPVTLDFKYDAASASTPDDLLALVQSTAVQQPTSEDAVGTSLKTQLPTLLSASTQRYVALRLHARPSYLLAAWVATPIRLILVEE